MSQLENIEEELQLNRFGYRAKYICDAARFLKNTVIDFHNLTYNDAREKLMSIKGIGRKVADCICLISLKHFFVVPLDTHLIRYSKKEFNLSISTINDRNYSYIQELWKIKYGEFAGVWQLYAFNKSINSKKIKINL